MQANAELLTLRKQLRATERALLAAGATDVRLAVDSEIEVLRSEVGRLSVDLTAERDHRARLESSLAEKEGDYQAARENARGYLKELALLRSDLTAGNRARAAERTALSGDPG